MDANTPAWLQDNTTEAPAPAAPSGPVEVSPPPPPTNNNAAASNIAAEEDDPDLPGVILTMRLANMGVAVAIIAVSVRSMCFSSWFSFLIRW